MVDVIHGVTEELERLQRREVDLLTVKTLLRERLVRVLQQCAKARDALQILEEMGAKNERLEGREVKRIARAGLR